MKKRNMIIRTICFVLVFAMLFSFFTEVLKDKRVVGEYNPTTKVRGFYKEPKDSLDFVFIGSSQVYADIAPSVLFRDYGMTAYDFCANEQPLWISYYYIKEALKRQSPKAIILDVFTVYGADLEEEGVNHINLDDLPFGINKIQAIRNSVPKELRSSFYFEIAKYHTTWEGLDEAKFRATFEQKKDPMKGYSPFITDTVYDESAKKEVKEQKEFAEIPARANEWLHKIIELTRKENVDLILIKTPNGNAERQKLYNSVNKIAEENKIPFINMNTVLDGEAHINVLQAEKVTKYIGEYLNEHYELTDKRNQTGYEDWEESVKLFERYKKRCQMIQFKNPKEYLGFLSQQDNYTLMVSINGDVSECTDSLKVLAEYDIYSDENDSGQNYASITKGDDWKARIDNGDKDEVTFDANGHELKIKFSKDDDESVKTKMTVDGIQYNIAKSGVQIVVFDNVLEEAVDAVCIENDSEQMLR